MAGFAPVRITHQRFEVCGGELPGHVANSQRAWKDRRGIYLTLTDSDGVTGVGEASPLPGYSAETLSDVIRVFEGLQFPLTAHGVDLLDLIAAPPMMRGVSSACFAWESAMAQICARKNRTSIARLFSASPSRMACSAALSMGNFDNEIQHLHGSCLKLKIGTPNSFSRELPWIERVRKDFPAASLRFDVNGAWKVTQAQNHLSALRQFAPEFVEDPVPIDELANLLEPTQTVPIAIDEELGTPPATHLIDQKLIDICVLKPARLGGLVAAWRLAQNLRQKGCSCIVSHLFDGPVALSAAMELASAIGGVRAAGLGRHTGLMAYPPRDIPQLTEEGPLRGTFFTAELA